MILAYIIDNMSVMLNTKMKWYGWKRCNS